MPDFRELYCSSSQASPVLRTVRCFRKVFMPEKALIQKEKTMTKPAIILIVDDDVKNREVLNDLVISLGHTPVMAENGFSALDQMENQLTDLVLLDILMPKMDGYEVLDRMKANDAMRHIPVIMITAVDEIESAAQCIDKGAEDYLVKPFNSYLLKARIGGSLEKKYLRDREQELHAKLEQNFEALQRAEQARDAMFQMIIHDLKNPLTSILAFAEIWLDNLHDDHLYREGLAKEFRMNFKAANEMSSLIKSILDVSKLEAGEMHVFLKPVKATQLIKDICEQFIPQAEICGVHLSVESESDALMILADKGLLYRILQNLITNTLQHTSKGINVKISATRQANDIIISVTDNGPGIPGRHKDKVFEKFFQADVRKEGKRYGVGLGLTFCKMAVEAQRGKIWVESEEGKGTSFKVALEALKE